MPRAEDADWAVVAEALADAGRGVRVRWDAQADRAGDGRRTARHDALLTRVAASLAALAEVVGDPAFARGERRADRALADALAGPLAALAEDLRAAWPRDDREPAAED